MPDRLHEQRRRRRMLLFRSRRVRPHVLRTQRCGTPSSEVHRVPKLGVPRSLRVVDRHRGAVVRRSVELAPRSSPPTARSRDGLPAQGLPTSVSALRSLLDRRRDQTENDQPDAGCVPRVRAYVLEVARKSWWSQLVTRHPESIWGLVCSRRIRSTRYGTSGRPDSLAAGGQNPNVRTADLRPSRRASIASRS